jgi:hypothetical protein
VALDAEDAFFQNAADFGQGFVLDLADALLGDADRGGLAMSFFCELLLLTPGVCSCHSPACRHNRAHEATGRLF